MDVPMTYGVALRFVPVAMHVVSTGQATESNRTPDGMELGGDQVLRFTVLSEVPPPPCATPAATHVETAAHETDVSDNTDG